MDFVCNVVTENVSDSFVFVMDHYLSGNLRVIHLKGSSTSIEILSINSLVSEWTRKIIPKLSFVFQVNNCKSLSRAENADI